MIKNDALDALILMNAHVLAEKNLREYDETDLSEVVVPKSLDRRIERVIRKEYRKAEYGWFTEPAKRVVAALFVLCTIAFAGLMTVEAVRKYVWKAVTEFFDDFFTISYNIDEEMENADVFAPPETIVIKREPRDVPEEWTKEVKSDRNGLYTIQYSQNNVKALNYKQFVLDTGWQLVDNDRTIVANVNISGNNGTLVYFIDRQRFQLTWNDGEYSYCINTFSPDITKEELLEIANSVE